MDTKPELTYEEQQQQNEDKFGTALKAMRPDIWVIMNTLDQTRVNWVPVWKVIYAINNIATTTKYGKVVVDIQNNVVKFVYGENADKLNEPVLLDRNQTVQDPEPTS